MKPTQPNQGGIMNCAIEEEAIKAVSELNYDFMEAEISESILPFHVECDGCQTIVKYFGIAIWDDQNDEREHDGGLYEPLKPFLVKECAKLKDVLRYVPKVEA